MGYDMSMRGQTAPTPDDIVTPLEERTNAAGELARIVRAHFAKKHQDGELEGNPYDQPALKLAERVFNDAWNEYSAAKFPESFRLNIFGMGRYREAMEQIGMAHHSDNPVDSNEWPEWPEDIEDGDAAESKYNELADPLRARHTTDDPTIPLHKFGSNDGWVVTPEEIQAALAVWDQWAATDHDEVPEVIGTDYWNQWIDYLRRAEQYDGFRVY